MPNTSLSVLLLLLLSASYVVGKYFVDEDIMTLEYPSHLDFDAVKEHAASSKPFILVNVSPEDHSIFAKAINIGVVPSTKSCWYFVDSFVGENNHHMWKIIEAAEPCLPQSHEMFLKNVNEYMHRCTSHINCTSAQADGDNMIPPDGACYKGVQHNVIVTFDKSIPPEWPNMYVTAQVSIMWHLYLQSMPTAFLVYSLMDGLYTPPSGWNDPYSKMGLYNMQIGTAMWGTPSVGVTNDFFLSYSNPPTQNNVHTEGQSQSVTDSRTSTFNLGFNAKSVSGGFSFGRTQSYMNSYSHTTDITDWSLVEKSDASLREGWWLYYESWPVNTQIHYSDTWPSDWTTYYSSQSPCIIKEVPNLCRYTSQLHTSAMWTANPSLMTQSGVCNVEFSLRGTVEVSGLKCPHESTLAQNTGLLLQKWTINIAALDNVVYS